MIWGAEADTNKTACDDQGSRLTCEGAATLFAFLPLWERGSFRGRRPWFVVCLPRLCPNNGRGKLQDLVRHVRGPSPSELCWSEIVSLVHAIFSDADEGTCTSQQDMGEDVCKKTWGELYLDKTRIICF